MSTDISGSTDEQRALRRQRNAEEDAMRALLPVPSSLSPVHQCREMGVAVGDTIIGRFDHKGDLCEVRMTLLWTGENMAVFREQRRYPSSPYPDSKLWSPAYEVASPLCLSTMRWRRSTEGEHS